jgi:hypothetical protein
VQAAASTAGASKKVAKTIVIAAASFAHVIIDQVIAGSIRSAPAARNMLQGSRLLRPSASTA